MGNARLQKVKFLLRRLIIEHETPSEFPPPHMGLIKVWRRGSVQRECEEMTNCIHDHARWGAGDQLGAANLLTPEHTVASLALVKEGRTYDLSQMIKMERRESNQCSRPMSSIQVRPPPTASSAAERWARKMMLAPIWNG